MAIADAREDRDGQQLPEHRARRPAKSELGLLVAAPVLEILDQADDRTGVEQRDDQADDAGERAESSVATRLMSDSSTAATNSAPNWLL